MGMSVVFFVVQMIVGALSGYLIGRLAVWTINRINLANHSLYSVLLLAFIFFSFAFTDLIKGNGYLAVYLSGLVVGNYKLQQKRPLTVFFDGFTWLMQIVMFLTLGLFVNSDELLEPRVLILGGLVGAFMILVARPLTVFICMAPFRKFTTKARLYVSWVGLRGAVPIFFAIYPLMAHVENAGLLFNVVFLGTIISLLVQGTTVSGMANLLGLAYEERVIGLQRRYASGYEVGPYGGGGQRDDARKRAHAQGHHAAGKYAGDDGLPQRRVFRAAGQDRTAAGRQTAGHFGPQRGAGDDL